MGMCQKDSHKSAGREEIDLGIVEYKHTSDSSGISLLKDSDSLTSLCLTL